MTTSDVERMQQGPLPMGKPYLEPYRPIVAQLNEQVILTLLRYTARPTTAALVSGMGNHQFIASMAAASCSTLLQSARNMGRPLVELTINETYLDRVFSTVNGVPVEAPMRGLLARVMCTWDDFAVLLQTVESEVSAQTPRRAPKIGRPTAVFLPPGEADTIERLIAHGVTTKAILAFTQSEVNSAQVRRLRQSTDPDASEEASAEHRSTAVAMGRFQDSNAAVWGSTTRRLTVTSIFAHQRILVAMGLTPHAAFVEAYEHYATHYCDPANPLSLSRLISAVFMPLRAGLVHLGHCEECGTMHLSHDGHHNGIECPVCALAKFRKLGRSSLPRVPSPPVDPQPGLSKAALSPTSHDVVQPGGSPENLPPGTGQAGGTRFMGMAFRAPRVPRAIWSGGMQSDGKQGDVFALPSVC